ncbi:MAG TPA: DUF1794 domain-containing protein [Deltaproteobacteria bacterium]|nr:DUF1794 domain-containing protein [Deltaproteobacteria bacterium]
MSENENVKNLGPLAPLAGIWEGDEGVDDAPSDRREHEETRYRERIVLEPIGLVENHEQKLQALRYSTTAFRLGEQDAFHEEVGYWLWDAAEGQVMRCFMPPRGMAILAGGSAGATDRTFSMAAEVGAEVYGISSSPFLDREFKTVRYELTISVEDENTFRYEEDTQLKIKGQSEIFHHRDSNTLRRVG